MEGKKLCRISFARAVTCLASFCLSAWFLQDTCSPNYCKANLLLRTWNSVKFSAASANENSSSSLSLKVKLQSEPDRESLKFRALKLHHSKQIPDLWWSPFKKKATKQEKNNNPKQQQKPTNKQKNQPKIPQKQTSKQNPKPTPFPKKLCFAVLDFWNCCSSFCSC